MKTKHASQTAPTSTWKNTLLLAITALALCASSGSRGEAVFCEAQYVTNWIHQGAGDWFVSSNWDNGVPICLGPVDISNGGTAQIIGLTPTASACETFLGYSSTESGNLSVDHGTLNTCNELHVGYSGQGTLKITNGGLVSTIAEADIAAAAGSNGSATVDGSNPDGRRSTWTVTDGGVYVGGSGPTPTPGGTGLLVVTNDGRVTATGSPAPGVVHVFGSGTLTGNGTVTTTDGTTIEGTLAPKGGGTTLTFNGNLVLTTSATTECNVTPQDPSTTEQVSVTQQVTLGGRLSVTMTGDFTSAPTRFTLLYANSVDSVRNKFDSTSITYPTNQCWVPKITYDYTGGHVHVYVDRIVCTN
jgi:T5SS/PEP-CTERM-associated repeat protein